MENLKFNEVKVTRSEWHLAALEAIVNFGEAVKRYQDEGYSLERYSIIPNQVEVHLVFGYKSVTLYLEV